MIIAKRRKKRELFTERSSINRVCESYEGGNSKFVCPSVRPSVRLSRFDLMFVCFGVIRLVIRVMKVLRFDLMFVCFGVIR